MNNKITLKFLKKLNKLIFFSIAVLLIVLAIKYYQQSIQKKRENLIQITRSVHFKNTTNYILNKLNSYYSNIEHRVNKNETFNKIFNNYGISSLEIEKIKKELAKNIALNKIKVGEIIYLTLSSDKNKL